MTGWTFGYDDFDPDKERQREALMTLANGYVGTRGAMPHARDGDVHYPGTYIAGVYDRARSEIEGNTVEIESIVNIPNWLPLTWRIDGGAWLNLAEVTISDYRQELDLRRGVMTRRFQIEDEHGRRTQVSERRFVHMRYCHLAGLEITIQAENWSGQFQMKSSIDGRVINGLVESDEDLNNEHLDPIATGVDPKGNPWLKVRTKQSRVEIDVATRTSITINGVPSEQSPETHESSDQIGQTTTLDVAEGDTVAIQKIAAVFTSRDPAISESGLAARAAVANAPDFETLLRSHSAAWELLWQRCDVALEDGDDDTQLIVRLHLFHLLQMASAHTRNLDVGTLARGLTGEAYHGHIFWDELFILPWLNVHFPAVSRSMLRYRYLRLDEARRRARDAGYHGAMYPWQSGSDGREETPPYYPNPRTDGWIPDHTPLQRHVGSAIAYNIWLSYEATGDSDYLVTEGAEILLEIARFWSSIATLNPEDDRYDIHGVMGPDEFHTGYPWNDEPGLSNNTHTNVMAAWTLRIALESLEHLPAWRRNELCQHLDLDEDELARWDDVSRRLRIVFLDGGELAQFEHYERLDELDWDAYREKYGDLQRLDFILDAEDDTPNRYRISKQPDVLMLLYLFSQGELETILGRLGYDFDEEARQRTVEFYLQRSSEGSTLSRVVDAEIMAGSDRSRSWECLQTALQSDVGDIQGGSTGEGVHLGAMAGTIAILERRYAGIDVLEGTLRFAPALPEELQRLSMSVIYRGTWLDITVTHRRLQVRCRADGSAPVTIGPGDRTQQLTPDTPIDWDW
jgi:alpha,alpha-trehalase